MGRMPFHVHVFLYQNTPGGPRVALFRRADLPDVWQGVCGGGEAGESIAQAALRECREEAGTSRSGPLYPLDSVSCMRAGIFEAYRPVWGADVLALPMYFLAMPYEGDITLSNEHLEYRWCDEAEGDGLMRIPDQSAALWELFRRLEEDWLRRPLPPWMGHVWAGFDRGMTQWER